MALNVSYSGDMVWFYRQCYPDTSFYWEYKASATCDYTYTLNSDNSYTITIKSVSGSLTGTDHGYNSHPANQFEGQCIKDCCCPDKIYLNNSMVQTDRTLVGTYNLHTHAWLTGSWKRTWSGQTFTLKPGEWREFELGRGVLDCCNTRQRFVRFSNTNTTPANVAPTISVSCSGSATTGSMSIGGSCGYCNGSSSCSTSWELRDANGNLIRSGTGTSASFSGLTPNARYTVSATRSNGCYSRSASCSFTTCVTSTLSNATALSWQSGQVRLSVVNGAGTYSPTTQIQYRKCGGSWVNGPTSRTTTIDTITLTGLQDDTCYEVRAITSTSACSYTSNSVTFNTPKKCVQAYIANQNIVMNERNYRTYNDVTVNYTAFSSPFDIWIEYRVKNGFDKTWIKTNVVTVNTPVTTSGLTGNAVFRLDNLFQNLVEYEMRVMAEAPQDQCTFTGDLVNFTTPLVPEPDATEICASLTYLSELVCQSVKKLYDGNISILANPYTVEKCDPYNELPTHLTLWSRLLRFFHAMNCLVCMMMEAGLKSGKANQYYSGEIGWTDMLEEVVSDESSEAWRLVTSGAVKAYIDLKLHEVWHTHGDVDYLVGTIADRDALPADAKSCIVKATNKVYVKSGSSWKEAAAERQPDNFAVYHINEGNGFAKAESAWYYFEGTWNNLDADLAGLEERIEALENPPEFVKSTQGDLKLQIVEEDFDFENEAKEGVVYLVVESKEQADPVYHTVTFDTDDGDPVNPQQVLDGAYAQEPALKPVEDDCEFGGWFKEGDEPPACEKENYKPKW